MRDGREDFERVQLEDVNVTVAGFRAIDSGDGIVGGRICRYVVE